MQNMSNTRGASRDPRARRTRAQLRAAVLELSTERDLETVTMAEIAERAEVNRATVYLHYKDREDLLLDATDSTMSDIVDAVRACRLAAAGGFPTSERDPAPGHLVKLFTHVDRHRALYGRMLRRTAAPASSPACIVGSPRRGSSNSRPTPTRRRRTRRSSRCVPNT